MLRVRFAAARGAVVSLALLVSSGARAAGAPAGADVEARATGVSADSPSASALPAGSSSSSALARKVALLDLSPALVQALRTALLPWGMQLQLVARHQPELSLPGAVQRARALARELSADVLVG